MIKVGHSEEPPDVLVRSFDESGSSPYPYRVEYKVLLRDSFFHVLQNIRKCLWAADRNLALGWYRGTAQEVIPLIRSELSFFIIDRLRAELKGHHEDLNFNTLMQTISRVIVLDIEPSSDSTADTFEAREISKIIAHILKTNDWMNCPWGNRISGDSNRFSDVVHL